MNVTRAHTYTYMSDTVPNCSKHYFIDSWFIILKVKSRGRQGASNLPWGKVRTALSASAPRDALNLYFHMPFSSGNVTARCSLGGSWAKRHNQDKNCREGRIYYLQQLRRTQDPSQISASLNSKIGEICS